ncbi:hypothetical protein ACFV1L_30815 [Kitasatospora sp. NPDC059646]|uniref:hypothetical protein n=1 Tax=Kitasatospora sp. NPDC059646 TaxID=3346893 RepID=UPI0036A88A29
MTELAELVLTADERARGTGVDRVLLTLDWSGEEEPGRLAEFVAARVRALGADPADVDDTAVRRAAEADPALRRGDLPVRQLDHLSGVLAGLGCALLQVHHGDDAYALLVARTGGSTPDGLTGLTHDHCPVLPWGTRPTLVCLDCPGCAQQLVWELPPGETLAGERCDCGTALFDADGRPLPDVTLYP